MTLTAHPRRVRATAEEVGTPPAAAVAGTPTRRATTISMVVVAAAAGWAGLTLVATGHPALPGWLVVAGLLVSVPHGAVDHLVPTYRGARGLTALALVGGYVALALLVWAAWRLWPGAALVVFLLLSAAHFGSGEISFARLRVGRAAFTPDTRVDDVVSSAVLGATVVLLPVAVHGASITGLLAALVPGWDGVVPPALAGPAAAVLAAAALVLASVRWRQRRRTEATEVLLLLALALLAPAAAAIAVYLGGWHSVRHLGILLVEDPVNAPDLRAGRLARPVRRLAVRAALPSLAALATVAVLWRASAGGDLTAFVRVDVPLLAALTVPHALVVWWADRARAGAPAG